MLFLSLNFFMEHGIKLPMVFSYYSTRMTLAALTSFLISIFFGPFFIKKLYELKIGQTIRTDECPLLGQLHFKKKDTPTMGGCLILFSMLLSMLLWMDLRHIFTLILFITTLFLGLVGGWDDYLKLKHKNTKGLSARRKFLLQGLLGTALAAYLLIPAVSEYIQIGKWFVPPVVKEHRYEAAKTYPSNQKNLNLGLGKDSGLDLSTTDRYYNVDPLSTVESQELSPEPKTNFSGYLGIQQNSTLTLQEYAGRIYIPFKKDPIVYFSGLSLLLSLGFILFVVVGTSNAVNLTDGLDGLAAGSLLMVAGCLAFIAFVSNHLELAHYLNILYIEGSGEIAIYLSALAGACLGFLWYNSHPAQVFMGDTGSLSLGGVLGVSAILLRRELLLAIIGGIFVAEALSVILQVGSYKFRNKKRIFLIAPLHHHFEYKGWPETKVVMRFWIIGLILAIVGLASLKFQ